MVSSTCAWLIVSQQTRQAEQKYRDQLTTLALSSRMMFHAAAEEFAEKQGLSFHRVLPGQETDNSTTGRLGRDAMATFQADKTLETVVRQVDSGAGDSMYVFAPAYIRDECITCHTSYGLDLFQGKKPGEMAAVFGVSASMKELEELKSHTIILGTGIGVGILAAITVLLWVVANASIIRPLRSIGKTTDAIARGDLTASVGIRSNDEIGQLGDSINVMATSIRKLMEEIQAEKASVERRVQEAVLESEARKEYLGRSVVTLLGEIEKVANGNLAIVNHAEKDDEIGRLYTGLEALASNVERTLADIQRLTEAAVAGSLSYRANATEHRGDFRKIVEGVNNTLDAVIEPVQEGAMVLSEMARGDLTVRVEGDYRGDHQMIKDSINAVAESLEKALREVTEAVSATASASSEISSSTEQMAAGAQEQTSQTGEVASAVEEMTKTILENSRNAGNTAETAKAARETAELGGKVVSETVSGMKRIAEVVNRSAATVQELGKSSEQIGEIIGVIDDIADQTNLLALNAAIEAARAGEQGRGFAVVADEVRKLAERTTKATKEIAEKIKKIQGETAGAVSSMEEGTGEVAKGIALADRAGQSLQEIVGVSQKVTDMVTQIAAASEEQSTASEQISRNVEGISKVTSETAAGTQQIARAAEDLNRLTENLQRLVGAFRVRGGEEVQKGPLHRREQSSHVAVKENGTLVLHGSGGLAGLDVAAAKNAHKMWRLRVQKLMAGTGVIDPKDLSSHRNCKLGVWYYGEGEKRLGKEQSFLSLGKKHEEMHDAVKRVVHMLQNEDRNGAEAAADEVYRLSDEVIALLDDLAPVRA
jgi:methyl-accepting chemotaxis protein